VGCQELLAEGKETQRGEALGLSSRWYDAVWHAALLEARRRRRAAWQAARGVAEAR